MVDSITGNTRPIRDDASVALDDYRRKRDATRTPEPFEDGEASAGRRFVIQRHAARRLHYDLRIERDGVLASWAVPKGMPMTTSRTGCLLAGMRCWCQAGSSRAG